METLIAVAHIVGSILALLIWGVFILFLSSKENEANQKVAAEEISIQLGVKVEDLYKESIEEDLIKLAAKKFSADLFRNRFSDLCGVIQSVWGWLGNIAQVVFLLAVLWNTITIGVENAVYSWLVVGIAISFAVVSMIFAALCKFLTGRYPGQAKANRKVAAEWISENN